MRRALRNILPDQRGVTAVEYGLIILLVVVGIVGFVSSIGNSTCKPFVTAANAIGP